MLSINICLRLKGDFCEGSGADSFPPGALAKCGCNAQMCAICVTHVVRWGPLISQVLGYFFKKGFGGADSYIFEYI